MPCLPDHSSSSSSPKLSADTTVYSVGGGGGGGGRRTGHYKLKIIILLPQTTAYARAHGRGLRTCLVLTHVLTAGAYARA